MNNEDPAQNVPSDLELDAARKDAEAALAGHGSSLDSPALWLEPGDEVSQQIIAELASESPRPAESSRSWRWLAAAAVLVGILGIAAFVTRDGPDWSVQLGPTDDFPLAAATIDGWNEGAGTRMRVEISGVDPAPDGFFYEMWMSEGPVHVSAGTFVEVQSVELRAGVTRRDYPRLWVTLEPIDDDESPTRVVVIDTG